MGPRAIVLFVAVLAGCHTGPARSAATVAAPAPTGIDESAIDSTVAPCDDFFRYACGGWIARTKLPSDRPAWYRSFSEIEDRNETLLRRILDDAAAGKLPDPYADKLGAFWAACMDEAQIEAKADGELAALLKPIEAIANVDELARELARLHLGGSGALFSFGSQQDYKDATQVIGAVDQGGLGLPDRDYYLSDDPKMKAMRETYEAHVRKMLELAGLPAKDGDAAAQAKTVLRVEKLLAEASLDKVARRDPKKVYHRLDRAGLEKLTPRFPWALYFRELGATSVDGLNVVVPGFFAGLNVDLQKLPLADWRAYLRWHAVHRAATALSKKFVDENFAFYGKALLGTDEILPRWKRCVTATDHAIGEALGHAFVRLTFGADGKTKTQEMVHAVEEAMSADLTKLSWMDEPTRAAAVDKLRHIANKIGYPDRWRNYDALEVGRGSFLDDSLRAGAFETHRDLAKIGKPLDRNEWQMTPPEVNAYYDPSMNEMVFPAGILQAPFFGRAAAPPVNYGAIGMVMGHELTHGFDDEGRQFDAAGNLRDWWSPSVGQEFERRAACVTKQYDGYVAVDDLHVNGKLTLGENLADLGGVKLAYRAWNGASEPRASARFTNQQLFFLGYAQAWCAKRKDEYARMQVNVNPHSPAEFRVNGPLSNLPEFAAAFQCKSTDKMVRTDMCAVW
jgi:endothelin-converting enzyme/putative endopeptidase